MSLPQTPVRAETVSVSSTTTALGSALKTAINRLVVEEMADEDDQTYIVSDTDDSDESDYDYGAESEISLDFGSELATETLGKHVSLVDDACIALKDSELNKNKAVKFSGNNSVQAFLLKHEVPRKAFHSSIGLVTIYLYTCGFLQHQIASPLWAIFIATSFFELVRLNSEKVNKAVLPWVKYLIRTLERNSCNGIVFYLAGVSLVLSFASKDIAMVSILLLSWADTAASTVGRAWGKHTPKVARGKSLAGCTASFFVGVLVCYLYYEILAKKYHVNIPGDNYYTAASSNISLHMYALATGLIASISEAVDVAGLDDNFTIPVVSAVFLSALTYATHV